ncbi:MAG: hypothetical protein COA78_37470 [Blastopirellula sp.]|nr:MAG: hypothetical protein COA78_37470 [Blastopirellula sp.]
MNPETTPPPEPSPSPSTPPSELAGVPNLAKAVRESWKPCLGLLLAALLVLPAFIWYGYSNYGAPGIQAACLAAGLCLMGTESALLLAGMFKGTVHAVSATLAGMFLKTGIPLFVGLSLDKAGGPVAEAGLFGMILVYYLITLLVWLVLVVQMLGGLNPEAANKTVANNQDAKKAS